MIITTSTLWCITYFSISKMEHAQIQSSDGQVVTINGQQLQVVQMSNGPHMIQGPNGQQIVVHAIPSTAPTIQVFMIFIKFVFKLFYVSIYLNFKEILRVDTTTFRNPRIEI